MSALSDQKIAIEHIKTFLDFLFFTLMRATWNLKKINFEWHHSPAALATHLSVILHLNPARSLRFGFTEFLIHTRTSYKLPCPPVKWGHHTLLAICRSFQLIFFTRSCKISIHWVFHDTFLVFNKKAFSFCTHLVEITINGKICYT